MKGTTLRSIQTILAAAVLAAVCFAQTQTARLVGTVHDTTGAVLPNAKVVAMNLGTKQTSEATTNANGDYVMPALQPGTYSLTVEANGFRKARVDGIDLAAAANVSQAITLEVGQLTEVVEVTANTVNVQTTDSQVANSVTIKDIETLPQLARTPITLAIFQPGVQVNPQANGSSSGADYSFAHVNGLRQGSNNNSLDGIDVNDSVAPRIGLSLTANNTDSVEEARVITDGGKAEYGRSAGAQVQLVTRGGTNQFHGNAFDYLRNRDLNANDFFDNAAGVPIPVLIQNTYGGSFGGPIKHNKLFFFGNYQGVRTHAQGVQNTLVPTATAQQGIFQWATAAGVQQYNILNADPLHKGIGSDGSGAPEALPRSQQQLQQRRRLELFLLHLQLPQRKSFRQFTIKMDYNLTDKMHIFERTSWQRNSSIDLAQRRAECDSGQDPARRAASAGAWREAGTDHFIDHGQRVSLWPPERDHELQPPEREAGPMVSLNTWTTLLTAFPQGRNSPVDEYTDNLTKIHGSHSSNSAASSGH